MVRSLSVWTALAAVLLLSACGGGSSTGTKRTTRQSKEGRVIIWNDTVFGLSVKFNDGKNQTSARLDPQVKKDISGVLSGDTKTQVKVEIFAVPGSPTNIGATRYIPNSLDVTVNGNKTVRVKAMEEATAGFWTVSMEEVQG